MTVAAQSNRYSYSGNGVTTAFAYSSLFLANADLVVVLVSSAGVETVQTITTHYTVSGAGNPSGGTVTMLTAPASGETLVIYGDPAITQTLDLVENDQFPSASVESAFDRLTLVCRRLYDMFSRTLRLSEGVVGVDTQITGVAASRANKYIAFDSSGNLTLASTVDPSSLTVSTFMETVLDDLDVASARATLGFTAGADIASATTVDLTAATGNTVVITGTTTTTALTMNAGQQMVLVASGAWPLTHHATNLNINGGANYTCTAGDRIIAVKDGGGVVRVTVIPVSLIPSVIAQATAEAGTDTTPRLWTAERVAQAIAALETTGGITLGTPVASTSGTSIDFTSIPSGTKRITINLAGVSTNSTSNMLVQIGDSGGIENTGYISGATNDNGTRVTSTAGFVIQSATAASDVMSGRIVLELLDSAAFTWTSAGQTCETGSGYDGESAGSKSLSAELDRVRITTVGGTATFDAGKINITYE